MNSIVNYFVFIIIASIIAYLFLNVYYIWIFDRSKGINSIDYCLLLIVGLILLIISAGIHGSIGTILICSTYCLFFLFVLIYYIFR